MTTAESDFEKALSDYQTTKTEFDAVQTPESIQYVKKLIDQALDKYIQRTTIAIEGAQNTDAQIITDGANDIDAANQLVQKAIQEIQSYNNK